MSTEIKIRPGEKIKNSKNFETKKSTYSGKIETLRRKTIRREKYNGGAK